MSDRDSESNGRRPGEAIHRLAEVIDLPVQPPNHPETIRGKQGAELLSTIIDDTIEMLLGEHLITFKRVDRANIMAVELQESETRLIAITEHYTPATELYAVKGNRTYYAVIDHPDNVQHGEPESAERLIKLLSGIDSAEWARLGYQETREAFYKLKRLLPRTDI